jgi:chromatin segregation and condensation protein Rec8/ScpA/Scc1 (kleisin family)
MDIPIKQPIVESDYEVKLGVFEGPLDLLLYLVQKNELNPREIPISTITDQYLKYIDGIEKMNLSNAGEFLVMAARLMRLKARELLPADQKDELEEMEYELDRQALIQQMLEYQKFKEAARVLRNFEGRNFGAFARGREDNGEDRKESEELEEEAGIFDLLSAFRSVVLQRPKRIPVHEVEIDDVTIEDRMQEVEIALNERGRSQFEDLFPHDNRTIVKVVTLMAMLELCKLDRVVFRQSHALGVIWVYRKAKSSEYEMELRGDEGHQEPLPEFRPGLPELIREQAKQRTAQTALESALRELEWEMAHPGEPLPPELLAAKAAAAAPAGTAGAPPGANPEAGTAGVAGAAPADGTSPEGSASGATLETATEGAPAAIAEVGSAPGTTPEAAPDADALESGESAPEDPALESAQTPAAPAPESAAGAAPEAPTEADAAALLDLLGRVRAAEDSDEATGPVPGSDEDDG